MNEEPTDCASLMRRFIYENYFLPNKISATSCADMHIKPHA